MRKLPGKYPGFFVRKVSYSGVYNLYNFLIISYYTRYIPLVSYSHQKGNLRISRVRLAAERRLKMAVRSVRTVFVLAVCIVVPMLVGGFSSMLVRSQFVEYAKLNMPPGAPAAGVFPVAWTLLYIMMGIASFLIFSSSSEVRWIILMLYAVQLILNFMWSPVFFNMHSYGLAAIILMVMFVLVLMIIGLARDVNLFASWLLVPYAAWCIYAMYLNLGVMALN